MGFGRRVVRKSVRRATPRPVRHAMHPARTARNAVTPRPVKWASRAAYTTQHPMGATEKAVIGAVLYPPKPRLRHGRWALGGLVLGFILFIVSPWLALGVIVLAIVIPVIASRRTRRGMPPRPAPPVASPTAPQWPPMPPAQAPVQPPVWHPPVQQAPVQQQQRIEPWPAHQAFRTPPPDITPPRQPVRPPSSAGQWEIDARRQTGLGDGRRSGN
jgi:hypothetical protein